MFDDLKFFVSMVLISHLATTFHGTILTADGTSIQ